MLSTGKLREFAAGVVVWRFFYSSRRRLRRPSTGILRIPRLNSHRADKVYFECTRSETERKSGIRAVPDIVPDPLALPEKTLRWCYDERKPRTFFWPVRDSPKITSGCFHALKSQPDTSVRDFVQHLDPSLTLRVGIYGTYFGTVPKSFLPERTFDLP